MSDLNIIYPTLTSLLYEVNAVLYKRQLDKAFAKDDEGLSRELSFLSSLKMKAGQAWTTKQAIWYQKILYRELKEIYNKNSYICSFVDFRDHIDNLIDQKKYEYPLINAINPRNIIGIENNFLFLESKFNVELNKKLKEKNHKLIDKFKWMAEKGRWQVELSPYHLLALLDVCENFNIQTTDEVKEYINQFENLLTTNESSRVSFADNVLTFTSLIDSQKEYLRRELNNLGVFINDNEFKINDAITPINLIRINFELSCCDILKSSGFQNLIEQEIARHIYSYQNSISIIDFEKIKSYLVTFDDDIELNEIDVAFISSITDLRIIYEQEFLSNHKKMKALSQLFKTFDKELDKSNVMFSEHISNLTTSNKEFKSNFDNVKILFLASNSVLHAYMNSLFFKNKKYSFDIHFMEVTTDALAQVNNKLTSRTNVHGKYLKPLMRPNKDRFE